MLTRRPVGRDTSGANDGRAPDTQGQKSSFPQIRLADSWRLAGILGLISSAIVLFVWGDWTPQAQFHDEAAYVLQGQIHATGRWSAPSPPEPAFFEQTHMLVTPGLAAK